MKINKKDLKDGQTGYLFFHSAILDRSGDGQIGFSTDEETAVTFAADSKVYEVVLKERPIERYTVTESREIEKKRLKPKE